MTKEQEFSKRHAERLLVMVQTVAETRLELTVTAARLYGETGSWIAGGFQEHWPNVVKDTIRDYARQFGTLLDQSLFVWTHDARCKRETWIKKKESLGVHHY